MQRLFLGTFFVFLAYTGTALAGTETLGGFVKGATTVAEVEQRLGAPVNTTMRDDGALTLIYPVSRMAPAAATAGAPSRAIALHFGTDFILRDAIVTEAVLQTGNRFAAD